MTQMLRVTCLALLCAAGSGCENDAVVPVNGPAKVDHFGLDGAVFPPPRRDAATIDAPPGPDAPLVDVPGALDEGLDAWMAESAG